MVLWNLGSASTSPILFLSFDAAAHRLDTLPETNSSSLKFQRLGDERSFLGAKLLFVLGSCNIFKQPTTQTRAPQNDTT